MYPTTLTDKTFSTPPEPSRELCRRLHTSEEWQAYFMRNAANLLPMAWGDGTTLTPDERQVIARSIRQFQLGESSEGNHLRSLARGYAFRTGDTAYAEAMVLFIREEQRHARDLGRFMDLAGIPRATTHWSDTVFRGLRKLSNLEMMLSVLLAAELIAKAYYAALREATTCSLLRRICQQILHDEEEHVHFHTERLAQIRADRRISLDLVHLLYQLFFSGTCVVVWAGHAPVFKRAGVSFRHFWRACRQEIRKALHQMDPRAYLGFEVSQTTPSSPFTL